MSDAKWLPEVDPNPAEPRMVIWSTLRCLELQIDQHEELYNSHGVVSWELLKHMVRLAKRHAHEEGNKIGAAERETDQWRTRADEANAKLRETEQELDRLRQRHVEVQSEEVAAARAEIETLRKELDAAKRAASDEITERQVLTVEQQQDAAIWQQQLDAARAEIETLKGAMAADDQRLLAAAGGVGQAFLGKPSGDIAKPGSPGHREVCQSVYELAVACEWDRLTAVVKAWQQTNPTNDKKAE